MYVQFNRNDIENVIVFHVEKILQFQKRAQIKKK